MTRLACFFALAAFVAVAGCDTQTPPDEEEEEVEEKGPILIEYRVDAPDDLIKFVIRHTDADGEVVVVPVQQPFAFPFVPEVLELPAETVGTFEISITGTVPSGEGAVRTSVLATQDGLRLDGDEDADTASAADRTVAARSEVVLAAAD